MVALKIVIYFNILLIAFNNSIISKFDEMRASVAD